LDEEEIFWVGLVFCSLSLDCRCMEPQPEYGGGRGLSEGPGSCLGGMGRLGRGGRSQVWYSSSSLGLSRWIAEGWSRRHPGTKTSCEVEEGFASCEVSGAGARYRQWVTGGHRRRRTGRGEVAGGKMGREE
jgi:hypothetical protein